MYTFYMSRSISRFLPAPTVFTLLGERVREHRLQRNIPQAVLAKQVGLGRASIVALEKTGHCSLDTLVRVLRGLDLLENLDALIPPVPPSPILAAKLRGKERKYARSPKKKTETP